MTDMSQMGWFPFGGDGKKGAVMVKRVHVKYILFQRWFLLF